MSVNAESRSPQPTEKVVLQQVTAPQETQRISIGSLLGSDSPRINGQNAEHIELMAVSQDPLPPILIHRQTMRVIDGMHRLQAAQQRGEDSILVQFFDGTVDDAFVMGVRANIQHGWPLTRADREAAAARIIASHPHHSDRRIAADAGLAAQTVANIRNRIRVDTTVSARIGRDGRIRPVNGEYGRSLARDALEQNPQASLREIARIAGISPATVRDVRSRMQRGEDPLSRKPNGRGRADAETTAGQRSRESSRHETRSRISLLERLSKDPSVRATEPGRKLLRSLRYLAVGPAELLKQVVGVPPHSLFLLAEFARGCADDWLKVAQQLEQRLSDEDLC